MIHLQRRIYGALVGLHPAAFRNQFGREMELDFEDALHSYGPCRLGRDVLWSLARQWSECILSGAPDPVCAPRPSLLAGDYVMIRDQAPTPLELGRGLASSVALIALCLYGLGGARRAVAGLQAVYASSSTPAGGRDANPGTDAPAGGSSSTKLRPSQSTVAGFAQSATTSTILETQLKAELLLFHPSGPLPFYEVATIKPLDPEAASSMVKLPPGGSLNPLSMRRYIMDAYGATYMAQVAGGPDWLNKDSYLIHGKVPDDLDAALHKMTSQDRVDQNRGMQQALLADRFHLKAHFETRVLPVYELIPAKGGLKISEVPAPPERRAGDPPLRPRPGEALAPGTSMTTLNSNGLRVLNGRAIQMQLLARIIGGDAGDRPIVNHTGFAGYFDITDLTWAPLGDAAAESAPDAPSLAVALGKTLGVKVVAAKAPIEVLVIDHIEKPSEN
jgi:uncharacterized protein (TIGR03435 family)